MSVLPEPELAVDERAALTEGVRLFNDGFYFECHDVLEDLWSGLRGPSRDFFQGLIQVSVGYYHLGNGNRAGALSLFGRALQRLAPYPDGYCGFALDAERRELEALTARLSAGEGGESLAVARPRWTLR